MAPGRREPADGGRAPQVLAPEQPRLHVRGVEAPPLLDGRQGASSRPGRAQGHGLRHVEVALPCKSVHLPRVPHVEVVGQVPQRLHLKNSWFRTQLSTSA